jgi:hypothetical protein
MGTAGTAAAGTVVAGTAAAHIPHTCLLNIRGTSSFEKRAIKGKKKEKKERKIHQKLWNNFCGIK